jgi:hypothetical protein
VNTEYLEIFAALTALLIGGPVIVTLLVAGVCMVLDAAMRAALEFAAWAAEKW